MASCEPDTSFHYHSRARLFHFDDVALFSNQHQQQQNQQQPLNNSNNLAQLSGTSSGEYFSIPSSKATAPAGFAFEISANLNDYQQPASVHFVQHHQQSPHSLLDLLKHSSPSPSSESSVSFRHLGSSTASSAATSVSISPPLLQASLPAAAAMNGPNSSKDGNNFHPQSRHVPQSSHQPSAVPSYSNSPYALKGNPGPVSEGLVPSNSSASRSPSNYFSDTVMADAPPASNREQSTRTFQHPQQHPTSTYVDHLGFQGGPDVFTPVANNGLGLYSSIARTPSSQSLGRRYHVGREVDMYGREHNLKGDPQGSKIEPPRAEMGGPSSWGYPIHSSTHQIQHYQGEVSQGTLLPSIPQLPSQPSSMTHLSLNPQTPTTSDATSSRGPSPSAYSYHGSTTSTTLHSAHSSIYAGGGLSSSSTSSFQDSELPSDQAHSPNGSPFMGSNSRGVGVSVPIGQTHGTATVQMDYGSGSWSEQARTPDVMLYCTQCTLRFANSEQFAKHQIKHQKLHRCRIQGCNRVEGFTTPNDRDRHEKSVHKTPGMYFRCMDESCASYGKTFARRDNLKDHLKRMHKMPVEMDEAEANERRNELADSWRVDLGS